MLVICFISQWMKRSKHWLFVLPPKKTLIWRRHCSIGQSCCSIEWFLESSRAWSFLTWALIRLTNQKQQGVGVRSIKKSNRSISNRFCFGRAFSFQGHRKIGLSWDGWQIRWISSDSIMSGSFIFPGTHRNTSAKMTENMAAGLKQERQKKHTQLSYKYVLPLLRKFQFKTPLTIETPYLLFGISSIPP